MTFARYVARGYPVREAMQTGVRQPPRGEDLPCSDGEPMESERHFRQMMLLILTLNDAWRDRTTSS